VFVPVDPAGTYLMLDSSCGHNSLATACAQLATDIVEDLNVASQSTVEVPIGATDILFTANDSYWQDNTDPNNDYGVSIETVSSAPIIIRQTNQFCDVRSVNDVNFGIGKFLTVTADLTPDGDLNNDGFADNDGVSLPSDVRVSQDGVNRGLNYFPLPTSPNHFARSIRFNCDDLSENPDLRDPWSFSITNAADDCASGKCFLENGTVNTNPVSPNMTGVPNLGFINSFTLGVLRHVMNHLVNQFRESILIKEG
jgi:hypothetical protein